MIDTTRQPANPRNYLVIALLCLGFCAATIGIFMCAGCASMTPAEQREAGVLVASSAADLAATHAAERRAGVVEGNPVMRGPIGKQIAVNAAADALVLYANHELRIGGSTRWKWPSRVIATVHFGAAGANLRFVF